MVGEHAREDVGLYAVLEVMEDRPLHQRALHGPKGRLYPREQDVETPDLLVAQVLAIGPQEIGAVEMLGAGLELGIRGPRYRAGRLVRGEGVVTGHARVALLEAAEGFVDLRGGAQAAAGDAGLELGEVAEEPLLVFVADRLILLPPPVAATEDMEFAAAHRALDEDACLLLARVARRRRAEDLGPTRVVLEGRLMFVPFRRPPGHD